MEEEVLDSHEVDAGTGGGFRGGGDEPEWIVKQVDYVKNRVIKQREEEERAKTVGANPQPCQLKSQYLRTEVWKILASTGMHGPSGP